MAAVEVAASHVVAVGTTAVSLARGGGGAGELALGPVSTTGVESDAPEDEDPGGGDLPPERAEPAGGGAPSPGEQGDAGGGGGGKWTRGLVRR